MYKVLIVDDEKMIRMGMKKVLPWQEKAPAAFPGL